MRGPCVSCGRPVVRDVEGRGVIPNLLRELPLFCDACIDREDEAHSVRIEADLEEQHRQTVERRRLDIGLPTHLASFRFSDLVRDVPKDARTAAFQWAQGDFGGLLLGGTVGVGKTRLAVAAANLLVERRRVRWYSGPSLMATLGSGAFDSPARTRAMEALTGTDALILDDVDKARPTEWAAEVIFAAVDQRCDGAAPLLVTTNMQPDELAGRWPEPYGEAIASRFTLLRRVKVGGSDRRRKKREAGDGPVGQVATQGEEPGEGPDVRGATA